VTNPKRPENATLHQNVDTLQDASFLLSNASGPEEAADISTRRASPALRPVFRESPFGKNSGVPSTFANQIADSVRMGARKV
jgi:hypothetical protein